MGHTPFGHAGEYVLNEICEDGFRHNEQSVRIVEKLEKKRHGFKSDLGSAGRYFKPSV